MAGVIMAVLGLLAAEDLKYKAVTVWKLVLFGLVCTIQAVRTVRHLKNGSYCREQP